MEHKKEENLRIIALGGLGEVGRNMTLLEYKDKILIMDMGFRMPGEDMPGIDYIIPNIDYLKNKERNVVGVAFTHGHYDHLGAVPYLIKRLWHKDLKILASPLTKAIILKRQTDYPDQAKLKIQTVKDGSRIRLDPFEIEFFRQNHNITDNLGIFIKTPVGNIVNTSDFKFDLDPVNEPPTDFQKLKKISERRITLLMCDSTGAEKEGHSLSEGEIYKNLEKIFRGAPGRIITATFASLINRIEQIILLSEKYGRKVAIEGYSMKNNINIVRKLGYITPRNDTMIKTKQASNYPDSKITILCTGAQGENSASLMRITNKENPFIRFKKGDTVIFSSSVIPGNERTVQAIKDDILRQGAKVFHYRMMDIHASGHGKKEELKKMIQIMKPKFFLPIHGQYSMLVANAELAMSENIPKKNIVIAENGQVINLNRNEIFIGKEKVPSGYVMVDGLGVGDIGEIVLKDRQILAEDGMFVIIIVVDKQTGKIRNSPDIISRGFIYLKESGKLLAETRKRTVRIINNATNSNGAINWIHIKNEIRKKIREFLFSKTKRRPVILPVIIEV